mmetsp:Transcript_244/g.713  ORF Transcript_244/g.713 Transcript_244/m.713 type:complete len:244 (+) Transcript_244:1611-2342(+)
MRRRWRRCWRPWGVVCPSATWRCSSRTRERAFTACRSRARRSWPSAFRRSNWRWRRHCTPPAASSSPTTETSSAWPGSDARAPTRACTRSARWSAPNCCWRRDCSRAPMRTYRRTFVCRRYSAYRTASTRAPPATRAPTCTRCRPSCWPTATQTATPDATTRSRSALILPTRSVPVASVSPMPNAWLVPPLRLAQVPDAAAAPVRTACLSNLATSVLLRTLPPHRVHRPLRPRPRQLATLRYQ